MHIFFKGSAAFYAANGRFMDKVGGEVAKLILWTLFWE